MNILFGKNPNNTNEPKKYGKYGAAKRHIAVWQWYIVVIILVSPIFFIFYKIVSSNLDDKFRGFVNFSIVKITSPASAYVVKQNINMGSKVKIGEELVELGSKVLQEKLNKLEEKLAFLVKRKKITITQNTNVYKSFMNEANVYLENTNQYRDVITNLRKRGLGTIYQVHGASMDNFNILMSKELLEYDRFYYQAEVTRLGQEIIDTKLEISLIKEKQNEFKIASPVNGEVVEINTSVSEYISKDHLIAQLADFSTMYIKAYMPPKLLDSGEPLEGRKVSIYFGNNLKNKFIKKGVIVGFPAMTDSSEKIIQTEEKNTLLYIKVIEPVPNNYYTLGYPVKVKLSNN